MLYYTWKNKRREPLTLRHKTRPREQEFLHLFIINSYSLKHFLSFPLKTELLKIKLKSLL